MNVQFRRPRLDRKLYESSLQVWVDWLHMFVLPRTQGRQPVDLTGLFEAVNIRARAPGTYSNPVESSLLRDERMGYEAGASINAIVLDFPREYQVVLIGRAFGMSQAEIGAALGGLAQQRVSELASKVRPQFLQRVRLCAAAQRKLRFVYDIAMPAPLELRTAVID